MGESASIEQKIEDAKQVVQMCIGNSGLWASSDIESRDLPGYHGLCWTRDFASVGIDGLLAIDRDDIILKHLENIQVEQDGSVATFFVDQGFDWWADKKRLLKAEPFKRGIPYAWKFAKKQMGKFSPHSYTPQTTDTALHYINMILMYSERLGNNHIMESYRDNIDRALSQVEANVVEGLYRGGDERDNMEFPENVALLSNNSLLYNIYTLLGNHDRAQELKAIIQEKFWTGTYHTDHPDTNRFDVYGQAVAVLYGIADSDQYESIISKLMSMETEFGFRANDYEETHVSRKVRRKNIRVNQLGHTSPWAIGYMILALDKVGKSEMARRVFSKWTNLEGFREWHDSITGEGRGAVNYMASASMYLRVSNELNFS